MKGGLQGPKHLIRGVYQPDMLKYFHLRTVSAGVVLLLEFEVSVDLFLKRKHLGRISRAP
jgi:hypothetical protein